MSEELLPCPFCGGEAQIRRYGTTRYSTEYECLECGCSLETGETFNHGTSWNTRQAPKVKALEWKHRQREPNYWWSNYGDYQVDQAYDGTWYCHGPDGPICKKMPDSDAAKAAAQADYERRILSALEE